MYGQSQNYANWIYPQERVLVPFLPGSFHPYVPPRFFPPGRFPLGLFPPGKFLT